MSDTTEVEKKNIWVILNLDKDNFGFVTNSKEEGYLDSTSDILQANHYSILQARTLVESLRDDEPESEWWILPLKNKGEFL